MAAPTVVLQQLASVSTSIGSVSGNQATRVFTQVTVAAGDRIAVQGRTEDAGRKYVSVAQTAGAATLGTWTQPVNLGTVDVNCGNAVFLNTVTTGGTLTLTATIQTMSNVSTSSSRNGATLFIATGATATNTSSSASARQLSYAASASSWIATVTTDWTAAASAGATFVPATNQVIDVRATDGVDQQATAGASSSIFAAHWTDTGAGGTATYGLSSPSAGTYNTALIEFVGGGPARASVPITYVGSSAWVAPASSTAVAPSYPTGLQQNDIVYAEIVVKPDTATITTPTGWTFEGSSISMGGGTQGAGTGAIKTFLYSRVVPSGGLTGTQSFTITSGSSPVACMRAFRYGSGLTNPQFEAATQTSYSRTTGSTTFGGSGAAGISLATNDYMVHVAGSSDDQSSTITISALAATGATFGTVTQDPAGTIINAQGNDISAASAYVAVTAGSSTAAPSATVTGSSAETGGGFFYRVRATAEVVTNDTGALANVLPPLTAASAATVSQTGSAANTFPPLTAASVANVSQTGAAANTLPPIATAGASNTFLAGVAANSFPSLGSASAATVTQTGALANVLPPLTAAAAASVTDTGTSTPTLPPIQSTVAADVAIKQWEVSEVTVTVVRIGSAANSLPPLGSVAAAQVVDPGVLVNVLPPVSSVSAATVRQTGALSNSLPPLQSTAAGTLAQNGVSGAGLPPISSSITASSVNAGSEAASLPPIASSGSANVTDPGASAAGLPPLQVAGDATTEIPGTSNSFIVLPSLESAATGTSRATGTSTASFPALSAALSGDLRASGASVGVLPPLQGVVDATAAILGLTVALLPALRSLGRLDTDSHGSILTVEVGPEDLIEASIAPDTVSGAIIDLAAGLEGRFA